MQDLKELGFILLIIVVVIAGLQWLLLRFTHWSVALIATGIIGFFISGFYVAMSNARPNGGSSGPPSSEYFAPAIIIISALLLGLWFVAYISKIQLNKFIIIIPLSAMILFAVGKYIYDDISSSSFYFTNFSSCEIEFVDESRNKSNVEEISFRNSTSGFSSDILIKPPVKPNSEMVRFADTIEFRNYSANKAFIKKFPFDYSLFKEKAGPIEYVFWRRSHNTLPMKIVLLPDDNVDLYLGGNLVKQYHLSESEKTGLK